MNPNKYTEMTETNVDELKAESARLRLESVALGQTCSGLLLASDLLQSALRINQQLREHSAKLLDALEKSKSTDQTDSSVQSDK